MQGHMTGLGEEATLDSESDKIRKMIKTEDKVNWASHSEQRTFEATVRPLAHLLADRQISLFLRHVDQFLSAPLVPVVGRTSATRTRVSGYQKFSY
jgi:hypothetical protein